MCFCLAEQYEKDIPQKLVEVWISVAVRAHLYASHAALDTPASPVCHTSWMLLNYS